ncbi:MAG: accessory factor UbiK family protein [Inquilinus sp.]|nr:accessory factor UbiK family protein [Inquilinus sp.]
MQVDNKLLDDMARVAAGAVGAVTGVRDEVEAQMRQRFERLLSRMDLVSREEFEVVRELAANARREQEALVARVEALERRLGGAPTEKPPAVVKADEKKEPAAKKATAAKSRRRPVASSD